MSVRELKRAEVLGRVKAGDLTLHGASAVMGLSYRQAKRLWKRFRRKGAVALRHRSVGRRSPRRKPAAFRRQVLALVRREFGGDATHERFGPTLTAEHLHDEYGLDVAAWARDGLLPKAVAHLNPKFKSADVAILVATIISILGILLAATIDKYALASVLALMVIQVVLAWCVLKIPQKLPELYAKSLIKFNTFWRWFTFLGAVITSVFILLMGILLDTMDKDGNPTQMPWTVFIFLGVLVIGAIWYISRRAYLKSKGIDLDIETISLGTNAKFRNVLNGLTDEFAFVFSYRF